MKRNCQWFKCGDKIECALCGRQLPGTFSLTTRRTCQAEDARFRTLTQLIDTCPHRGDPTGREVTCGCASMPKQPVFRCAVHGEAIRYRTGKTEYKGIACIECDVPREKLEALKR